MCGVASAQQLSDLFGAAAMRDDPFSSYPPSRQGKPYRPTGGQVTLSPTAVRVICGLSAPLAFVASGICFAFLVKPFGTNPPPKEVALIVGVVFAAFGLILVGIAAFYRGTPAEEEPPAAPESAAGTLNLPTPDWARAQMPADPWALAAPEAVPTPTPARGADIPAGMRPFESPAAEARRKSRSDWLWAAALLGVLIGPVLAYFGYQRQQVLNKGKHQPKNLTVAELGANGPGDNIHVKLTDFEFGTKRAVRSKGGSWTAVCLAAFPPGRVGDPRALKVIVRTSRVRNEQELREFSRRPTIEGVVVNSIYEWENDKAYMKEAYPGVDTSCIWVVQESYTFPNDTEIRIMFAAGGVIAALGVCSGFAALAKRRA
jgi:hypothetical protein